MCGRAGSTRGRTTHVMIKFVRGIKIPTMVKMPIERYSAGTESNVATSFTQ